MSNKMCLTLERQHPSLNSPMERAIICFSGFGEIFILSTIDRMGLKVVLAVNEAGMCHRLLFADDITFS